MIYYVGSCYCYRMADHCALCVEKYIDRGEMMANDHFAVIHVVGWLVGDNILVCSWAQYHLEDGVGTRSLCVQVHCNKSI